MFQVLGQGKSPSHGPIFSLELLVIFFLLSGRGCRHEAVANRVDLAWLLRCKDRSGDSEAVDDENGPFDLLR